MTQSDRGPLRASSDSPPQHDQQPVVSPSDSLSPNAVRNVDDPDSISRPSLYSHQPKPRSTPLEQYYGDHLSHVEILDELKSDRLEGVYNLSFLLLAFAMVYLFMRNIVDNGFLAGPSAICFSILFRDLKLLALFIIPLPFLFIIPFNLILLHSRSIMPARFVLFIHFLFLCVYFVAVTNVLFMMSLNPLLGVVAGIVVVIVGLKMHSYVMTNLVLAEEVEKLRESRRGHRSDSLESDSEPFDSHQPDGALRRRRQTKDENTESSASSTSDNEATSDTARHRGDEIKADSRYGTGRSEKLKSHGVKYPRNVTLNNIGYFVVAPTLVYETGYPRSERMRTRYVAWHALQVFLSLFVSYVLLMQFCVPVWRTSAPTDRLWWFSLKLALPCFFMWLLLFWGFFHCALNMIAELTRFADRLFYMDWWNATDLNQFWRTWNMPVHEWCIRHLYLETVQRQRLNRKAAVLGTFLLSAVFHEYVCIVGFRMVRPYMFAGMIIQVPLMQWSTRLAGTRSGNYVMWIMLFIGQSCLPLLYSRDYLGTYDTLMCRPLYQRG